MGRENSAPVAGSINRVADMIKGFWLCRELVYIARKRDMDAEDSL